MFQASNASFTSGRNRISESQCGNKECNCTTLCKNCIYAPIVPEHPEIELLGDVLDRVLLDIIKSQKR